SESVGKDLYRKAAPTMKAISLELGGNAPFIVFEDANIDSAVDHLVSAKLSCNGQNCLSPNRVFVQQAVHGKFIEQLSSRLNNLQLGDPVLDSTDVGPLINPAGL